MSAVGAYRGFGVPVRIDRIAAVLARGAALVTRTRALALVATLAALAYYRRTRRTPASAPSKGRARQSGRIDSAFVASLRRILAAAAPRLLGRPYVDAALLAVALLGRTALSLLVARYFGQSIRQFAAGDFAGMRRTTPHYFMLTVPAALLNASLHYLRSSLALKLRERVTLHVHRAYMAKRSFYNVNKVGSAPALAHADQLIAEDVEKWADTLSEVFAELLKPLVDVVVFTHALWCLQGKEGPLTFYAWFALASFVSGAVLPAYGRIAVRRQELEGEFRSLHARLVENAEMVAFMGGAQPEQRLVDRAFVAVRRYARGVHARMFASNSVIGYVNKYAASALGFSLVVLPVLWGRGRMADATAADISGYYVESSRLLLNLAEAILALFEVQKLVGHLSGLTARVDELLRTLDKPAAAFHDLPAPPEDRAPIVTELDASAPATLCFENVSLYRPDGALLVRDLTFSVPRGTRVLVRGENGVGKSALFRVLRGLWPLAAGHIVTPPRSSLRSYYFLAQANFVPIGSLRAIVTYPETPAPSPRIDEAVLQALAWAHLRKLRVNGVAPALDTALDWQLALSPGQKQRMAFARLFYHRPLYAVLDDCTNGVAPDIERDLYRRLRVLGVTVMTISHKNELRALHDYELELKADATYEWRALGPPDEAAEASLASDVDGSGDGESAATTSTHDGPEEESTA